MRLRRCLHWKEKTYSSSSSSWSSFENVPLSSLSHNLIASLLCWRKRYWKSWQHMKQWHQLLYMMCLSLVKKVYWKHTLYTLLNGYMYSVRVPGSSLIRSPVVERVIRQWCNSTLTVDGGKTRAPMHASFNKIQYLTGLCLWSACLRWHFDGPPTHQDLMVTYFNRYLTCKLFHLLFCGCKELIQYVKRRHC